jgi:hypothetical protein
VLDIGLHLHLAISGVEWSRNLASIPGHPPIINHFITVLRIFQQAEKIPDVSGMG